MGGGFIPSDATASAGVTIPLNRQRVLIGRAGAFVVDPDIACASISRGIGTAGSEATFVLPRLKWDDAGDDYAGAEVLVYASENGAPDVNGAPWFHGWLASEPSRLAARVNEYAVHAVSAIRLLDQTVCGLQGWTLRDWDGTRIVERRRSGTCPRYSRLSAMRNGRRCVLWHPRDVLVDLFSGLSTYWAQAIGLGNTDALREQPYKTRGLVEWDFTSASMLEALETVVSSYGDVAFVERFTGGNPRVLLDFFNLNDRGRGRKTIRVPRLCNDIASNRFNVQEIGRTNELGDRRDRVILTGSPYRVMVTVWTGDVNVKRQLRRGWVSKQITMIQSYEDGGVVQSRAVTKSNEEWVLDDPDYGRRGSDLFHPDCEYVFRRYYLPACLLAPWLRIERENAVRQMQTDPAEGDPKRIEQQVFMTRLTYSTRQTDYELAGSLAAAGRLTSSYGYDGGGEYGYGYGYEAPDGFRLLNLHRADLVGSIVMDDLGVGGSAFPLQLVDGAKVYEDGSVMLSEPAVNLIFKSYVGSKEQVIRAEADVAVTVTVAYDDRLVHDTGQPPYEPGRLGLIGQDGSILAQTKDDWEYSQVTNMGEGPRLENGTTVTFPFVDPATGESLTFGWCVYQETYDPDADDPAIAAEKDTEVKILRHVTAQEVVRNDYPLMQEFARRLLTLRSKPKRVYDVLLPLATSAFSPGDLVEFDNVGDVVFDDYNVVAVDVDFAPQTGDFSTRLTVDNAKPEESIRMEV